jgi:thiamine-phosphate pyrophosphorylase
VPVRARLQGLYAIVDLELCASRGLAALDVARALCAAERPPAVLQVRAKGAPDEQVLGLLSSLREPAERSGVLLLANDRPDLAARAAVDGVHVGQGDLAPAEVRARYPGLLIGVSTHDLGQLECALAARPDYVAFGPVLPTGSKVAHEPPVGLDATREAGRRAAGAGVPLVAIGGLTVETVAALAGSVDLVAVIGALLPPSSGPDWRREVAERAQALTRALSAPREDA